VGYAIGAGVAYVIHLLRPMLERLFEPILPAAQPARPNVIVPVNLIHMNIGL
jgi:hypothetical protein